MINKTEVDMAISVVESLISLACLFDPAAKESKIVQDLQSALAILKSIGL